jgi:hypothetical protein
VHVPISPPERGDYFHRAFFFGGGAFAWHQRMLPHRGKIKSPDANVRAGANIEIIYCAADREFL